MLSAAGTAAVALASAALLLRAAFSLRSLLYLLARFHRWLDDIAHPHQTFTIPRYAGDDGSDSAAIRQENPLFRKASLYLSTLPSVEDADGAAILSSGRKPHDVQLLPLPAHPIHDSFLSARLSWTSHPDRLSLRLRRQDRRRVLRPYLQHLESLADDVDLRRRDLRLFTPHTQSSLWASSPFTHPATLDSIAMDPDLKSRLRADLDSFLKARTYYHRLGRVWRRSYLLHGPPGTGKSSFVAAMAKFLAFDIYYLNLTGGADLRALLLQTTPRSLILVEDLDRYLAGGGGGERVTEMLNLMDGVLSCCGEERVMVFTMSGGEGVEEAAAMRPGRIDVNVHFPMCDFAAFKTMAGSYLGLKDHKLYPQVEEGFQSGAAISPAEVGEIMIANRGSPSRAIKTVISALQRSSSTGSGRGVGRSGSVSGGGGGGPAAEIVTMEGCGVGGGLGFGKDATMREFRKLYGLIKMRGGSRKEGVLPLEVAAAQAAAAAANGGGGSVAPPQSQQRRQGKY